MRLPFFVTTALVSSLFSPLAALEYQAVEKSQVKAPHTEVLTRSIRVLGKKVRRESASKDGAVIQTFDFETRSSWLEAGRGTTVVKIECKDEVAELLVTPLPGEVVAHETTAGVACEKRKIQGGFVWVGSGIVRRVELQRAAGHPILYEYEAVEVAPQPSALFARPKNL